MKLDMFKFLPFEIIINILLRLAVPTIGISKCVCKSWHDLLSTDEFVKSHLSKSAAAVAILTGKIKSSRCTIFDLEDEIDGDQSFDSGYNISERGLICVGKDEVNADALFLCHPLTKFNFPVRVSIQGSANGMLLLNNYDVNHALYVCNPITREYIELRFPEQDFITGKALYGFGVSKISGQHKAVCIKSKCNSDCHVYTLGTGSWRHINAPRASFRCAYAASGAFFNGYLHWIVRSNATLCISCFDLEMECFSTFLIPGEAPFQEIISYEGLCVLRDCLCYCDEISLKGDKLVIWLMKEYGDDKSWTKEYVISLNPSDIIGDIFGYPIKVFKDGGIMMVVDAQFLYYYSNKTKTFQKIGVFTRGNNFIDPRLLTPSFLSLKSFQMENVISL